jgi:hypothetical protein
MARRDSGRRTSFQENASRLLGLAALAALALAPAAVRAAKLNEVRVGTHEDHTRIVLQLDAPADYRMVSGGSDTDLTVALDAKSTARQVPSKSPLVRSVQVEPSASGSTVHVKLARPGVQVTEMILSNPPRIVFDLARGEAPVASNPPPAAAEKPEPVAAAAAPEPAPPPPPPAKAVAPMDAKLAAAKPAIPGAKADLGDPLAAPAPEAKTADTGADHIAPPSVPAPPMPAEPPVAVEKPTATPPAPGAMPPSSGAAPMHRAAPAVPASHDEADSSWLALLMSPMGLVVAGGVLLLGIILVAMRRRRAAADDDPLYSVMSAEDASASAEEHEAHADTETTVRWDTRERQSTSARDVRAFEADGDDQYGQLPLGRSSAASGSALASPGNGAVHDDAAATSIFGGDPDPAPASPRIEASTTATLPIPTSAPAAPQGDAMRKANEVEGRVADLERRLEQLVEARERLERQVAAQTEELRVQRAAIARTQRVVRSMTKGDELVTEPVPRAPNA